MVWYVRPPSGGQFGPARGDIMRKWIDEGRVSADSLVWREGWAEWQTAAEVLPTLATGPAVPAAPLGAPSTNGHSASGNASFSANQYRSRRRKSNQLAVISVIMLVLVSIALLVTLIVKMQSGV
jgi:hypothetical protein